MSESTKYSSLFPAVSDDDDEITKKIPLSTFAKINDAIVDMPFASSKIVLFQAKIEYQQYYSSAIYGAVIRTEAPTHWLGVPIKNPTVGLMRWDKKVWNKIYGFSLNISILEDV